jgi:hypothetical protein
VSYVDLTLIHFQCMGGGLGASVANTWKALEEALHGGYVREDDVSILFRNCHNLIAVHHPAWYSLSARHILAIGDARVLWAIGNLSTL